MVKENPKIVKKLKEFGLDGKYIGSIFQNRELPDIKIRWDGIVLNRRKYPIKFYDLRSKLDRFMLLDYFKANYYYVVEANRNEK